MTSKVFIEILILCVCILKFIETDMSGFIVGGNFSVIENFPHVTYLHIDCGEGRRSYCGGSVLNQAIILTAAHCVYKCIDMNNYSISAYTGHVEKYKGLKSKVIGFKIHENYIHKNFSNDVALMVLERDLRFNQRVKRIMLMRNPPKYKTAMIAGWGWVDDNSTKTKLLKHTIQEIMSYEECSKVLPGVPVGTICGNEPGGSHPQRGDSGSALVIHNFIEIGLASHFKRRLSNTTLVYTDVPYFYDWIVITARAMCSEYECNSNICSHDVRVNNKFDLS